MYKAIDTVYVGRLLSPGTIFDAADEQVAELLQDGHIERVKKETRERAANKPESPVEKAPAEPPKEPTVEETPKNASAPVKKMNASRKAKEEIGKEE